MKRTGSMASSVPPAVTSTFLPESVLPRAPASSSSRTMSCGSGRRPTPEAPQAKYPAAGSILCQPRAWSFAIFSCVTGFSYIALFIAGAKKIGDVTASSVVVSMSSAMPAAALAMMFAVAGAMSTRSAKRARAMCSTFQCAGSSHMSSDTGCPVISRKVSGVTKWAASFVMTT